jgi:hypothetical protein
MDKSARHVIAGAFRLLDSQLRLVITVALFIGSAIAQTSAHAAAPSTPSSVISELDTYVKIVGAAITGVVTLLGLPIVFVTYKKTRTEIIKLELEANALREQQAKPVEQTKGAEDNIRIIVDRSPSTNIQVLADPRFLAPLLILLDFIFASVVLTLAGHLLSLFTLGPLSDLFLTVLAATLLLPIAHQVLRVRTVLRPLRTPEEALASSEQFRVAAYASYGLFAVLALVFGIALIVLFDEAVLNSWHRYLAWIFIGWGSLMVILAPLAKGLFDRYLIRKRESDVKQLTAVSSSDMPVTG